MLWSSRVPSLVFGILVFRNWEPELGLYGGNLIEHAYLETMGTLGPVPDIVDSLPLSHLWLTLMS